METLKAKLTGIVPLLVHNGQLADPSNKFAKQLSKVVKGKAKDPEEARKIEFLGSLYLDNDNEPCLPADMLYAALIKGAAARKMGASAKAGVYETAPTFKLQYDGPKDPMKLLAEPAFVDTRGVRVGQNRVMRTRPIFRQWSVDVAFAYDESLIERSDVLLAIERVGLAVGLGDYRPRFGRFSVEVVK